MHNLKTIPVPSVEAHLRSLLAEAQFVADLSTGELMAQRRPSADVLATIAQNILHEKDALYKAASDIKTPPAPREFKLAGMMAVRLD